ncbi:MAG TPA: flagellar hook-basal body complex protein [Tepidisphaeraceae bacterium]|nr:flagellar hook-basal body complex protein [Tepidisphaeraceae bacterium]
MGLESALYTGLSGLSVNQQQLSVIGNNIANSNTTAFKSSRVIFTTEAYVTQSPGSPASSNFGGTNPSQTGLGATVGSIEKDFTAGQIQSTGHDTDMAINGDGFFVVQAKDGQQFTRNGAFELNANNQLVTTSGGFVQGYGVDSGFNLVTNSLQNITIPLGALTTAQQTGNAKFEGDLDAGGLPATTGSILNSQDITTVGGGATPTSTTLLTNLADASSSGTPMFAVGDTLTVQADRGTNGGTALTPLTFTVTATSTLQDLQDFMTQGLQIDTTVPPPGSSPAPGVSLITGTAPNSIDLSITGNAGTVNALSQIANTPILTSTGSGTPAFTTVTAATGESAGTTGGFLAYDSLGNIVNVNITATLQSTSSNGTIWQFIATSPDNANASTFTPGTPASAVIGEGTLTFNSSGQLISSTGATVNIDRSGTGAVSPMQVKLDFSQMTALSSAAKSGTATSTLTPDSVDGAPIGTLVSFAVGSDGTITGTFNNGVQRTLGQIAIATFSNQQGLVDDGNNMYSAGTSSGQPIISGANTLGAGSIVGDSLEQSNVDLSTEFVNLIMASTGFSASSRVITTSDQLVQDLLNTSR